MSKKYTEEQKADVLARVLEKGASAATKETGVPYQTVKNWGETDGIVVTPPRKKVFTEEQKMAILSRVPELGIRGTAREAGISYQTVSVWYKKIIQEKPPRHGKYTEKQKAAVLARIPEIGIVAAAKEAGLPRNTVYRWNKASEKTDGVHSQITNKEIPTKTNMVFETNCGKQIELEAIVEKIPKGVDAAYIKLEEYKIYWVKGTETGVVDIW